MPPTTSFEFGDIVLVPFPFTDQTAVKKRPAVVISSELYHRQRIDLIIMAITSQFHPAGLGDTVITQWPEAGLLKPSLIKPVITTSERRLVLRKLGGLQEHDRQTLRKILATFIG